MFLETNQIKKIGVAVFSGLVVAGVVFFLYKFIFLKRLEESQSRDFVRVMGWNRERDKNKEENTDSINNENKSVNLVAGNKESENEDSFSRIFFEDFRANNLGVPVKKEDAGSYYVGARSAVAIDADTQTILHYQDGRKKTAIASLTKVMTAVLVIEKIKNLDEEVITIDEEALSAEGTRVGCPRTGYCPDTRFQLGEQLTARSVLEAMLLNSANDAAIALGKHISGTQEKFANLMNKKSEELGLQDTHFCNPSGLDIEGREKECYSSAYDLARIAAYSFRYDEIWQILRIKEKEIRSLDGKIVHKLVNTDLLLDQMPNCLGGKTGFTYEAGKSLMLAAHLPGNKDRKVVAVIVDDNYRWQSMKGLLDWIFSAYEWPSAILK